MAGAVLLFGEAWLKQHDLPFGNSIRMDKREHNDFMTSLPRKRADAKPPDQYLLASDVQRQYDSDSNVQIGFDWYLL